MIKDYQMQKVADAATATSTLSAGAVWFTDLEPLFAAVAGLIAIVSGLFAIWYYVEKIRLTRKQRQKIDT